MGHLAGLEDADKYVYNVRREVLSSCREGDQYQGRQRVSGGFRQKISGYICTLPKGTVIL